MFKHVKETAQGSTSAPTNMFALPVHNQPDETYDIWAPGDLVATLPAGMKGPETVQSFMVFGGKGSLANRLT